MKGKLGLGYAVLLIALAVGMSFGAFYFLGPYLAPQQTAGAGGTVIINPSETNDPSGVVCTSETTPDWDPNAYDIDNPSTALTETVNSYRKEGDTAWDTFTQGTAETNLAKYARYEYVFGVDVTTLTDNAYGPHGFIEIPCQELITTSTALYDDDVETDLTATFFNENDAASTAQAFTAGAIHTIKLRWVAGFEDYFGNPYIAKDPYVSDNGKHSKEYPNVLCLDLNSTGWDKPIYVRLTDGTEMDQVPTPSRHAATAGNISYCYEAPVITDQFVDFYIRMDADDTHAIEDDAVASIYASNFYINTQTSEVEWGPENDQGTAVAVGAADTLDMDFTA